LNILNIPATRLNDSGILISEIKSKIEEKFINTDKIIEKSSNEIVFTKIDVSNSIITKFEELGYGEEDNNTINEDVKNLQKLLISEKLLVATQKSGQLSADGRW